MPNHFDASKILTLEDYAMALLLSMISIQSMEQYHIQTYKCGLMQQDEQELSLTICWELRRLITLYSQQLDFILDRIEITKEQLIEKIKTLS